MRRISNDRKTLLVCFLSKIQRLLGHFRKANAHEISTIRLLFLKKNYYKFSNNGSFITKKTTFSLFFGTNPFTSNSPWHNVWICIISKITFGTSVGEPFVRLVGAYYNRSKTIKCWLRSYFVHHHFITAVQCFGNN